MSLIRIYARALGLLAPEKRLAIALIVANGSIAVVQLAEPLLFGRVVDALAKSEPAMRFITLWAGIGVFGILASVLVAVASDRLAHRQRLVAMERAFERSITLPISYHAERGSGALVRVVLAGTDSLFGTWLAFMREQVAAFVGIILLVPTAITMNWRLAVLLSVLAMIYAALQVIAIYHTSDGQAEVERHFLDIYGRVGDVIGNVSVVQSFARLSAEASALHTM